MNNFDNIKNMDLRSMAKEIAAISDMTRQFVGSAPDCFKVDVIESYLKMPCSREVTDG